MTEDSAFFDLRDDSRVSFGRPECIHRSEKGWTELYRVERDGRFRVLKAIQAVPKLAQSDYALEQLGISQADIIRINADAERAAGLADLTEFDYGEAEA